MLSNPFAGFGRRPFLRRPFSMSSPQIITATLFLTWKGVWPIHKAFFKSGKGSWTLHSVIVLSPGPVCLEIRLDVCPKTSHVNSSVEKGTSVSLNRDPRDFLPREVVTIFANLHVGEPRVLASTRWHLPPLMPLEIRDTHFPCVMWCTHGSVRGDVIIR